MSITRSTDSRAGFCTLRILSMIGLVVSLTCLCKFAFADLPSDPFQRCATKALRGDFPGAPQWKLDVYDRGLSLGVTTCYQFLVTAYLGTEPDGRVDSRGNRCTWRTAASNRVPYGSYIWTEQWGIRKVLDCGARSNDKRADRAGCHAWADMWFPTARHARAAGCDGWLPTPGAVIPGA